MSLYTGIRTIRTHLGSHDLLHEIRVRQHDVDVAEEGELVDATVLLRPSGHGVPRRALGKLQRRSKERPNSPEKTETHQNIEKPSPHTISELRRKNIWGLPPEYWPLICIFYQQ